MSTALKLTTGDKISSTKAIDSLARFARRGAVLYQLWLTETFRTGPGLTMTRTAPNRPTPSRGLNRYEVPFLFVALLKLAHPTRMAFLKSI